MNFNKSILSIALSVAAVMFVGCSTDGYWDKAPIDSEVKYTFDQSEQTYSVAGTETLTEIKVSLTRNTNVGASTIAVDAKFNDPALSGPAEVTFADGSNTAIYTIAVGDIQVGVSYKATLSIAKDNTSVSGNSTTTINLSKLYNWVAAGSAQFYTSWSGTIDDNGLVGDGVKVDIEKAEGGNGLYRLVSPYYYSETAAGATGVTLEKGHHIQFTVNAANGAPVGFPTTVQKMGEASADDGNYYFAYTPGKNNCAFENDDNLYIINALVGYDEGGQLTEAVRRKPYSVVLFDEIEKAHPDVFNLLLQILDDGRLTDSQGNTVSFENTIIIMTSNVGSNVNINSIGFNSSKTYNKEKIESSLRETFRPEFLNRVDEIVIFDSLTENELIQIVDIMLADTSKALADKNISLIVSDEAKKYLMKKGTDLKYGARPLRRAIQRYVEDELSEKVLRQEINNGNTVKLDLENDELTFTIL